jgi:hypothetical protein
VRGINYELHCRAAILALRNDVIVEQQLADLWSMSEIVLTKFPEDVSAKKSQESYVSILGKGHVLDAEKSGIIDQSELVFATYRKMSNLEVLQACEVINKKYVKGKLNE